MDAMDLTEAPDPDMDDPKETGTSWAKYAIAAGLAGSAWKAGQDTVGALVNTGVDKGKSYLMDSVDTATQEANDAPEVF